MSPKFKAYNKNSVEGSKLVEVRSTLNGVCAACGKLGAVVGSSMFKPLVGASWLTCSYLFLRV